MVDVSKNTVAILVVLVILVSGFGTWSILTHASAPTRATNGVQAQQPQVGLTIQPPPKNVGYIQVEVEPTDG